MRDRELINRFCAFILLGVDDYRGDMDDFLAGGLRKMNGMGAAVLAKPSADFRRGLGNNFQLFGLNAFRRHRAGQDARRALNASFWDVMSTGLSRYEERRVEA